MKNTIKIISLMILTCIGLIGFGYLLTKDNPETKKTQNVIPLESYIKKTNPDFTINNVCELTNQYKLKPYTIKDDDIKMIHFRSKKEYENALENHYFKKDKIEKYVYNGKSDIIKKAEIETDKTNQVYSCFYILNDDKEHENLNTLIKTFLKENNLTSKTITKLDFGIRTKIINVGNWNISFENKTDYTNGIKFSSSTIEFKNILMEKELKNEDQPH